MLQDTLDTVDRFTAAIRDLYWSVNYKEPSISDTVVLAARQIVHEVVKEFLDELDRWEQPLADTDDADVFGGEAPTTDLAGENGTGAGVVAGGRRCEEVVVLGPILGCGVLGRLREHVGEVSDVLRVARPAGRGRLGDRLQPAVQRDEKIVMVRHRHVAHLGGKAEGALANASKYGREQLPVSPISPL